MQHLCLPKTMVLSPQVCGACTGTSQNSRGVAGSKAQSCSFLSVFMLPSSKVLTVAQLQGGSPGHTDGAVLPDPICLLGRPRLSLQRKQCGRPER